MTRNKDFSSYTALVTGASSGIGLEFARQLAARKVKLVLVSIDREELEQQAEAIHAEFGVPVETRCMDLSRVTTTNCLERLAIL